jgi:hypothetical protein
MGKGIHLRMWEWGTSQRNSSHEPLKCTVPLSINKEIKSTGLKNRFLFWRLIKTSNTKILREFLDTIPCPHTWFYLSGLLKIRVFAPVKSPKQNVEIFNLRREYRAPIWKIWKIRTKIFYVMTSCSLGGTYLCFGGTCYRHFPKRVVVSFPSTSI